MPRIFRRKVVEWGVRGNYLVQGERLACVFSVDAILRERFVDDYASEIFQCLLIMKEHFVRGEPNIGRVTAKLPLEPTLIEELTFLLALLAATLLHGLVPSERLLNPLRGQTHQHLLALGLLQISRNIRVGSKAA